MSSVQRDVVFIGGGHTHALVIKQLGMKPIDGVRITLISEQSLTPYSGMLPGFVAGHYSYLETHIDLNRLCQWAGVRFINTTATGIDADSNRIFTESGVAIQYDQLSIDIGSTPDLSVPGARDHAVGVKPVSQFGAIWNSLLQASAATVSGRWGVVGAGAGGVELVLAMAQRLKQHTALEFHLVFPGPRLLTGYPEKVVSAVESAMQRYNIELHSEFRVAEVNQSGLVSVDDRHIALDKSIWCTGAAAAAWLAESGLAVSDKGFIAVNEFLQSESHKNVFAVGDCSDMLFDPRPKAGVYAVRQAPFLSHNLRAVFNGRAMRPIRLQTDFLSLLSLGEKKAVGCRSGWTSSGALVWNLKDRIDRKFMRKLNSPGEKRQMVTAVSDEMHCAGCGSKLGPDIIADSLRRLSVFENASVTPALGKAEDASLWKVTPGTLAVQSIDGFRSFSSDLERFGRICVNHALSDLYAMGATAVSAQVWINLAHSHPRIQKRDHQVLMGAITEALNEQQVTLAGGHSSEGLETHVALVANGETAADQVFTKKGLRADDWLVLSKALGTGLILAADMQAKAPAAAVDAAFESMLQSNHEVSALLQTLEPSAVTDVTGFGLLGHLLEMLHQSELTVELSADDIPLLKGATELSRSGFRSSLYPHLQVYLQQCEVTPGVEQHKLDLLLDPQTSGGLLIALPEGQARYLLTQCQQACVIGLVSSEHTGTASKKIRIS